MDRISRMAPSVGALAPLAALGAAGCAAPEPSTLAITTGVAVGSFIATPLGCIASSFLQNLGAQVKSRISNMPGHFLNGDDLPFVTPFARNITYGNEAVGSLYRAAYFGLFTFAQVPAIYHAASGGSVGYALGAAALNVLVPQLAVNTYYALRGR